MSGCYASDVEADLRSKSALPIVLLFCIFFLSCSKLSAQQKGQYMPGQYGLNAGIMPDPGLTYQVMPIDYSADTLKGPNGGSLPLTTDYNIFAVENIFYYVFKLDFLGGAKFGIAIIQPTPANGSLTLGSVEFPNVAVNAGGFGLVDTWVQPVNIGWSFKRADFWVGYAFVAPTGRYTPGASNNIGSGYWGNDLISGTTVYLTKNKGTSANLYTDWEFHGTKTTSFGTNLTPGQTFTIEWGLGQVLPLDKQFHKLLQLGVIGYDQWQVTNDTGFVHPAVPANLVPYYSVHAIGPQINFILPTKALNFFFKFEDEYTALARPQGRTFVFGGSYTLRIPKPPPPKSP
jgi:hypothetical protein